MKLYIVEQFIIMHMSDTVLQDYDIFASLQGSIDKYPDSILATSMANEIQVEEAIEKKLCRDGVCYVIREKEI